MTKKNKENNSISHAKDDYDDEINLLLSFFKQLNPLPAPLMVENNRAKPADMSGHHKVL